jgi:molecular chaperone DnaK (HSP70)
MKDGGKTSPQPPGSVVKEHRIIVSIDFGTTYSGIAWAETSRVSRLPTLEKLESRD